MTRIAILSDVHGNVPAFEAVLEDLSEQRADEVLVGGDLVGRGPQGSHIVHRVHTLGWRCVRGNHEDYLLNFRHRRVPADWLTSEQWSASRWMAAELDEPSVAYIDALPHSATSRLTADLRLVHGTPRSNNEGLGPWSSDEQLGRHLGSIHEAVLVCGHTHRPMLRRVNGGTVVNTGAVGLPFNRDRRAQYVVLAGEGEDWGVDFRRVDYPVERVLAIYESSGFLASGGITAKLLRWELERAAPFLVPFLKWIEAQNQIASAEQLDAFLEVYDPDEPIEAFFARIEGPFR
jgi:putative phosphoesterase